MLKEISKGVSHSSRLFRQASATCQLPDLHKWTSRRITSQQVAHVSSPSSYTISQNSPLESARHQPTVTAAYVHLPFCKKKCFYCDFPVEAVGKSLGTERVDKRFNDYVQTLLREIAATSARGDAPLTSVYFGGGTPSLVPPALIQLILQVLSDTYGLSKDIEITLEADPGTFDGARLQEYRSLGVNRLSVGVQAFDEDTLVLCGRAHNLADVYRAIEMIQVSGISNWSLDLISGLPKLSMASWQHSLQEAVKAGPSHISVYDLQVEENTPFAKWYTPGKAPMPPDDAAADMYCAASSTLTAAGFEHYEISSYAKPGRRSRHNQVYWSGAPYYAFGVGAASYLEGRRFSRPKSIRDYDTWVTEFARDGRGTPGLVTTSVSQVEPVQTQDDLLMDYVMLHLRLSDGLDLGPTFQAKYGSKAAATIWSALQPHIKLGRAHVLDVYGKAVDVVPSIATTPSSAQDSRSQTASAPPQTPDIVAQYVGSAQTEGGIIRQGVNVPYRVRLTGPVGFLTSNDVISDVFACL